MRKALWLVWTSLLLAGCTNVAQAPAAVAATKKPPHGQRRLPRAQ